MESEFIENSTVSGNNVDIESSEVLNKSNSEHSSVSGGDSLQDAVASIPVNESVGNCNGCISVEDIEKAVCDALDLYCYGSEDGKQFSVVLVDAGLYKDMKNFTLQDCALVIICLILIAGAIMKIIGGGSRWNK